MSASSLISQLNGLSLGSPSFLSGAQRFPSASSSRAFRPAYAPLNIEAAHKKGTGSTKNGRDSNSKSRGVKVYGDQYAKAGSIIIRQCGTHIHPGKNVGLGKDYTIFSLIDGVVKFEKKDAKRKKVSVYPKVPTDLTIPVDNRRTRQAKYFHDRRVERKIAMGLLEAPTSEGEALPVVA